MQHIFILLMACVVIFLASTAYGYQKYNLLLAAKVLNTKAKIFPFMLSYSLAGDYKGRKIEIQKYMMLYSVMIFTRCLKKPKIKFLDFGPSSYPTPHTHYFANKVFYAFNPFLPYFRWSRSKLSEADVINAFEELLQAAQILESSSG